MLASTVQFSNNDQSPTLAALTHHSSRTGSTKATTMTAVPSGPNNVPDTPDQNSDFHAEAVLTEPTVCAE
jgi:hypothetical protein